MLRADRFRQAIAELLQERLLVLGLAQPIVAIDLEQRVRVLRRPPRWPRQSFRTPSWRPGTRRAPSRTTCRPRARCARGDRRTRSRSRARLAGLPSALTGPGSALQA